MSQRVYLSTSLDTVAYIFSSIRLFLFSTFHRYHFHFFHFLAQQRFPGLGTSTRVRAEPQCVPVLLYERREASSLPGRHRKGSSFLDPKDKQPADLRDCARRIALACEKGERLCRLFSYASESADCG